MPPPSFSVISCRVTCCQTGSCPESLPGCGLSSFDHKSWTPLPVRGGVWLGGLDFQWFNNRFESLLLLIFEGILNAYFKCFETLFKTAERWSRKSAPVAPLESWKVRKGVSQLFS